MTKLKYENQIVCGDTYETLKQMPSEIISCIMFSPPYWSLRDYKVEGQIGLEPDFNEYLAKMWLIFDELWRVLRKDGTVWVNVGDGYGGNNSRASFGGRAGFAGWQQREGVFSHGAAKSLLMLPERLMLGLLDRGWILRNKCIWCLSGATRVYAKTQKGEMPTTIKDLVRLKPETVKLWNGEKWTQVKGWHESSMPDKPYRIRLRSGEKILCTNGHVWPTQRGNIRAKDLTEGDIIKSTTLPEPDTPRKPAALPDDLIGWFVGLYIAEGSQSQGTIQISSHIKEIKRYELLKSIAEAYDGYCRFHKTGGNTATINIDSLILTAFIDTYVVGRTAHDKGLSVRCWKRSNAFLDSLLAGYLSGDGHWDEQNHRWRIGFCRNNRLASDLRTLCARLGLILRLNQTVSMCNGKEYPSFRGEIRYGQSQHRNVKNSGEILNIDVGKKVGKFWDIEVEDEPHLFALASGILTHNSKPNPMPCSAKDRFTTTWEYLYFLTKNNDPLWYYNSITGESLEKLPDWKSGKEGTDWYWGKRKGEVVKLSLWKSFDYFFDLDAVRRPHKQNSLERIKHSLKAETMYADHPGYHKQDRSDHTWLDPAGKNPGDVITTREKVYDCVSREYAKSHHGDYDYHPAGANPGDFLSIPTQPSKLAHYASYPEKLCETPLKAGCPRWICKECGMARTRVTKKEPVNVKKHSFKKEFRKEDQKENAPPFFYKESGVEFSWKINTLGWSFCSCLCPACGEADCKCGEKWRPGITLDPFCGIGTTLIVAKKLGFWYYGIDIKKEYCEMSVKRLKDVYCQEVFSL